MLGDVRRFIAQTNRYTAAVRKLLSLKGEGHDVSFGVHIEDERPEFSFLKGERRWAQFNSVTSAAGTLAVSGVTNPANSGVLVVITSVFAFAEAAGVVLNLETNTVNSAITGTSMFSTDLRGGTNWTMAKGFAAAQAAYAGHIVAQLTTLAANDIIDFVTPSGRVHEIILKPDSECFIVANAVGVHTVGTVFCGYERPLESGELISGG